MKSSTHTRQIRLDLEPEDVQYFNKWDKKQERREIEAITKLVKIEGGDN
jgi:hypothetical protein